MKDLADFVKIPKFFSAEDAVITKLSFISIVNDPGLRVEHSISSIEAIAEEMGRDYEIILCFKPGSLRSSLIAFDIQNKYENVTAIKSVGNAGEDYANLIRKSTGNYIIIFESSTNYGIEMADSISIFLSSNEKKAVFTSMLIIPRALLKEIGGWRSLRKCSEIDMLGRICLNFGILVFPSAKTTVPLSHLFSGTSMVNSVYHSKPKDIVPSISNILSYRDSIIGCNFTYRDIFLRIRLEKFPRNILLGVTLVASYILGLTSKSGSRVSSQNRYIQFVESMMESIIFREFEKYGYSSEDPRILINPGDLEYLRRRSAMWTRVNLSEYLTETDGKITDLEETMK
ncbi:MAG: hypothetical protein ACP5NK_07385 [Thermoplasmata archaeon]